MESALALVQQHAAIQTAGRVEKIVLRIGALAGVEVESLRFAFEVVARGTDLESASLEIESVPALIHCPACRRDFPGEDGFIFACPGCGDLCGEIVQGRELELSRIEIT